MTRFCTAVFSLLALSSLLAVPLLAQERTFTLEQILSSPFPAELTAAPLGGHLAWTFYDRGVRNIWVASPPDYGARPVTQYGTDDGQEIGQLAFAPNGRTIVYVRGGSANPLSVPEGVERAIWSVGVDGGKPSRLAEGSAPAVSPRGDTIAFLRQGEVWIVPLDGSKPAERLFSHRASSLRWSPDGSRLAFVSERGQFAYGNSDYSFVGVYEVSRRRITWLDPSVYRDRSPAWSPDGSKVAFVRMRPNLTRRTGFYPLRDVEPWSIRVVDASTGRGREIFRTLPGPGSVFRSVVAQNPILWAVGDRLVFPWEKDGWRHLYSISSSGGEPVLLTPGDYEIEHVVLNPRRNSVVYSSNQGDIDRRHLWLVAVAGGKPDLLTPGTGIEWAPVVTDDGNVLAFLRSDARRPARPAILRWGKAPRDLAPEVIPADFPSTLLVDPQPVKLTAADGFRTRAQLFLPRGSRRDAKRAAVIYLHGGPNNQQQLLGWFHSHAWYHHDYAFIQYLVNRGYIVLSLNYRSGSGYGLDFREAPEQGTSGASEYNDVLAAAQYLRGRHDVDPARIGLWGVSWGGFLAQLGLARNSDLFAAGVIFYGPYDWVLMWSGFVIPETSDETAKQTARQLAFRSSPIASVDTWKSPVLIIHGGYDRFVDFEQTVQLAEDLRRRSVDVEVLVYPDEAHGFLVHSHVLEALRTAADFFDRKLNGSWQARAKGGF